MKLRAKSLYTLFGLIAVAGYADSTPPHSAGMPYIAKSPDPFFEPWRWSRIEEFSDYELTSLSLVSDREAWFGTNNGVLFYDGYRISHVLQSSMIKDIKSYGSDVYAWSREGLWRFDGIAWQLIYKKVSGNWEGNHIARSSDGTVWVATGGRVLRVVGSEAVEVNELPSGVQGLAIDRDDRLWLGVGGAGRVLVCPLQAGGVAPSSRWIEAIPAQPKHSSPNHNVFHLSGEGNMWIANAGRHHAIRYFDRDLVEHEVDGASGLDLDLPIRSLATTADGTVWFGDSYTLHSLYNGRMRCHGRDATKSDPRIYDSNIVQATDDGRLIVGGSKVPLQILDTSNELWTTYEGLLYQCEDAAGNRWYLSERGEAVLENVATREWVAFGAEQGVISTPLVILGSSDGYVWAAGSHDGSAAISYYDGIQWRTDIHPQLGEMVSHLSAVEVAPGTILFGCGDEKINEKTVTGGVVKYVRVADRYRHSFVSAPGLPKRIPSIAHAGSDEYWIGGFQLLHWRDGKAKEVALPTSSETYWIDHVIATSQGEVWAAAWGLGIFRISNGKIELFNRDSGLRSNNVAYLLEDGQGSVWAATNEGISRYDGQTWTHGIFPNDLSLDREAGTLHATRDGTIWINTSSRNWLFRASSLTRPSSYLSGRSQTVCARLDGQAPETDLLPVNEKVHETDHLKLYWKGVDYWSRTPARSLEYSYRLDGGEWSPFSQQTETMLVDLDTGDHELEVRSRDSSGNVDLTPAVSTFSIVPAIWLRPWFTATAIAVALLILGLVQYIFHLRITHLVEIRDFKLWFFTQISHELKTPLTLILGPIESMMLRFPDKRSQETLALAKRNADRMLRLINQLLDFQKVEMGASRLDLSDCELVGFLRDTVLCCQPLATEKNQQLNFASNRSTCYAALDTEKLQKVVTNLVTNAIKYTPRLGQIEVLLAVEILPNRERWAKINVSDNGVGIRKEEQSLIFSPYYRGKGEPTGSAPGTGIGLALSNELTRIMNGTIDVESPAACANGEVRGTKMTISIPLLDMTGERNGHYGENSNAIVGFDSTSLTSALPNETEETERDTILLVDDNRDALSFLSGELESEYNVIKASNGRDAHLLARTHLPDLVVTDVLMPELDGHQLCRQLKTDRLTSHIPIIILTAKSSLENQLKGMDEGADEYLFKPVNIVLLMLAARNMLESRKRLRERIARQSILEIKDIPSATLDERFLAQVVAIIEERMADHLFNVEALAEDLKMSRMSLYRKLKAIIGYSPSSFIGKIRMKRAAQLLKRDRISVMEVCTMVGLNDSNYFSVCFKKEFKATPTEFRARHNGLLAKV